MGHTFENTIGIFDKHIDKKIETKKTCVLSLLKISVLQAVALDVITMEYFVMALLNESVCSYTEYNGLWHILYLNFIFTVMVH